MHRVSLFLLYTQVRVFLHKNSVKVGNDVIDIHEIYATRVPDVVSYDLYEWAIFHKSTLVHIITTFINHINQSLSHRNSSSTSQVYDLMFGSQTFPVYCYMGNFGCGDGGWTPAMKIDGTKVHIVVLIG